MTWIESHPPGGEISEHPFVKAAVKCIAELEAELAAAKRETDIAMVAMSREERFRRKAEAEVERLREENMKTLKSRQFPMWMQALWAEEDKEGGGRESDTSGEASPTRVASPPNRIEPMEPDPDCPACRLGAKHVHVSFAARKEREA